jgi:hypothetical protein
MKTWQRILIIWGGISLIAIILIVSYLIYIMTIGNRPENDKATKSDVRFVLNWCTLGDDRVEKVVNSYISPTSLTGDHIDEYSIKITHVTKDELEKINIIQGRWYRCDSLPNTLDDAVKFIGEFEDETSWFPKEEKIRTKDFYVYPWSMEYHGISPYAAQLIFINPNEKIVYYIDAKI